MLATPGTGEGKLEAIVILDKASFLKKNKTTKTKKKWCLNNKVGPEQESVITKKSRYVLKKKNISQ